MINKRTFSVTFLWKMGCVKSSFLIFGSEWQYFTDKTSSSSLAYVIVQLLSWQIEKFNPTLHCQILITYNIAACLREKLFKLFIGKITHLDVQYCYEYTPPQCNSTNPMPYKGWYPLFIFGLGSVVLKLHLTTSLRIQRQYITDERDRVKGVRATE